MDVTEGDDCLGFLVKLRLKKYVQFQTVTEL